MRAAAAKWRKCGHPRTPENTAQVSATKPKGQCQTCFRVANARYDSSEKGRARNARYKNTVNGQTVQMKAEIKYNAKRRGTR